MQSLRPRAPSSRTSMQFATWLAKRKCAGCQVWHRGSPQSSSSSDSVIRICTGCIAALANTCRDEVSLIDFGIHKRVLDSYFRADHFCKYYHDDVEFRQKTRKLAVDRAESARDGPIVPNCGDGQVLLREESTEHNC